jgi:hypothetical protein
MAKRISGSVGKGGKNKSEDILLVQQLLNAFSKTAGFKKLDEDGLIGPKTLSAIAAFQKSAVGMTRPDSRIDPGGESFSMLSMGPRKAEAEAKKAEKAQQAKEAKQSGGEAKPGKAGKGQESEEKSGGSGKPQVKGDTRGVDKKILAVLEEVSAHYGKPIFVETGKQDETAGGEQLWHEWANSLKRGARDPGLKRDERLRLQLDELYNEMKKDEFVELVAKNSKKSKGGGASAHTAGRAVDIKKNTDPKVIAALSTILRREDEGNVIHFDDTGKSVPRTISEAIKKKWK